MGRAGGGRLHGWPLRSLVYGPVPRDNELSSFATAQGLKGSLGALPGDIHAVRA